MADMLWCDSDTHSLPLQSNTGEVSVQSEGLQDAADWQSNRAVSLDSDTVRSETQEWG